MKRCLSILLAGLVLCAACAMNVSAAPRKTFNPDAIRQCVYLNDTTGITGRGHCGVLLIDANNYGRLYHFIQSGLMKFTYSPTQLQRFLAGGRPFPESEFQFDNAVTFGITPEEGRRMYDHAETTEFGEFCREASFFAAGLPIKNDNCLTVALSITSAGSCKYSFLYPFGLPNSTFYTMQLSLRWHGVPYTVSHPESERVVPKV